MSAVEFPEFQFSADGSENREKIDFKLSDDSTACDLRNSLAWDTAFLTSPGILDMDELFQTLNIRAMDHHNDKKPSSVSAAARYDNRQSLAWDSAFFTSAGVLDAEELSIVNKGFRNSVAKSEPETWRSIESNSTANSDGSSLASLEIDLFSDIKGTGVDQHLGASSLSSSIKHKGMREGNGGSSSGKPPRRISSRGGISTLSTQRKMSAVKSTTPSRSPSSVLPATTRNGSSEQALMRTPPRNSRRTAEPHLAAASVPTSRTPLKFLSGSRNGLLGSSVLSSSSFSSTPKVSPASSISGLSSSSDQSSRSPNQKHRVSPVKSYFTSASPRGSSIVPRSMKRFTGGSATPKSMQASGLKMPSPKLGYFDSENPSGSAPRTGNLKSNSHGHIKTAVTATNSRIAASRTSLGKHHLGEILALSLDSRIGNNERWQDSFTNKKKRCLKEDGERQGKGSCSCNKRPGSNKENSLGVAAASLDSQVDELSRHLKAIHFNKGFSPVWK